MATHEEETLTAPLVENTNGSRIRGSATPTAIDSYIKKLRVWAIQNDMNPHSMATGAGLSPGSLRFFWKMKWNPTVETLRALEVFMFKVELEKAEARLVASASTPASA